MQATASSLLFAIPAYLFVLTIVVTVHELGHFLAAKWCGVAIDQFSIGFGKAIVSRKDKAGVEWRLGWIPFGGYVRFSGDENAASVPDQDDLNALRRDIIMREGVGAEKKYYHFKPVWQRAVIAAAGPFANFVLAVVIFTVLFMAMGEARLPTARIDTVAPGSAAAKAGLMHGDLVKRIDGRRIDTFDDLSRYVLLHGGSTVTLDVERNGQPRSLVATIGRRSDGEGPVGMGVLGVTASRAPEDVKVIHFGPVEAVGGAFEQIGDIVGTTATYIGRIFAGRESGSQLNGPLGIANTAGVIADQAGQSSPNIFVGLQRAFTALIWLAAFMSVGVGFFNLMPLPVLDGGHLLFYAYEAVAQRPLGAKIQAIGYRIGLVLLLGLMLFATRNDLQHMGVFKFFGGLFS